MVTTMTMMSDSNGAANDVCMAMGPEKLFFERQPWEEELSWPSRPEHKHLFERQPWEEGFAVLLLVGWMMMVGWIMVG